MLIRSQILAWNGGGTRNFTEIANQRQYSKKVEEVVDEVVDEVGSFGRFFNELK